MRARTERFLQLKTGTRMAPDIFSRHPMHPTKRSHRGKSRPLLVDIGGNTPPVEMMASQYPDVSWLLLTIQWAEFFGSPSEAATEISSQKPETGCIKTRVFTAYIKDIGR